MRFQAPDMPGSPQIPHDSGGIVPRLSDHTGVSLPDDLHENLIHLHTRAGVCIGYPPLWLSKNGGPPRLASVLNLLLLWKTCGQSVKFLQTGCRKSLSRLGLAWD
jgi:hypothetical protein